MKLLRCWCSNPTGENFLLLIYSSLRSNTKLTTLTTLCITGKLESRVMVSDLGNCVPGEWLETLLVDRVTGPSSGAHET